MNNNIDYIKLTMARFRKELNLKPTVKENVYYSKDDLIRLKAEISRLKAILRAVNIEDGKEYQNLLKELVNELNRCRRQ